MWFQTVVVLTVLYSTGDRTSPGVESFSWCRQETPGYWQGHSDETLLEYIRTAPIKQIRFNRGGSTISLHLIFRDGGEAAFKPDQIHIYSTTPRHEIAAYRLNRILGLSRVPPATWRILSRREIIDKFAPEDRRFLPRVLREITWNRDGTVAGEVSYWIPVIRYLPLDRSEWRRKWYWWLHPYSRPAPGDDDLACQVSKMVLFDFLINNPDRFSGFNTMGNRGFKRLFFMDNTMSFGRSATGHRVTRRYLGRVRKFSRSMIQAIMKLDDRSIREVVRGSSDAPWPILTDQEIDALLRRRDVLMEHVVRTVAQYGWSRTMVYP